MPLAGDHEHVTAARPFDGHLNRAPAIDLDHPSLRGVERGDVLSALVLGCGGDVFV